MIEKIDIENFGSYSNFKHDSHIDSKYTKLNICYGKNYSGKSTFSKIFQAFERKELPIKYEDIKFSLKLNSGATLTQANVCNTDIKARVFNSEYIRQNLNFFNEDGIYSFALLGNRNIKTEEKISQLEQKKLNLDIEIDKLNNSFKDVSGKFNTEEKFLDKKKTLFASSIRKNNNLFLGNYDKRNFEREIENAQKSEELTEKAIIEFKQSIIEEEKIIQPKIKFPENNFLELLEYTNELLKKVVKPSNVIKELENNKDKHQWVKLGLSLHKKDNTNEEFCSFCGNPITMFRYELLDQLFSEEISNFEIEIKQMSSKLVTIKETIDSISLLNKDNFYAKYQNDIEILNQKILLEKKTEIAFLDELFIALEKRISSTFYSREELKIDIPRGFYSDKESLSDTNDNLYEKNKNLSNKLDENKKNARYSLRMDFIRKKLNEINYIKLETKLANLKEQYDTTQEMCKNIQGEIKDTLDEIKEYRDQLSNEKVAALTINSYLNNFLGHEELCLDVSENADKQSRFIILRQEHTAHNLSEGEMSLIAFAYFLASLKEIAESEKSDTIIFIDDPISSLDENNIFYIYSLIHSEIIEKNYGQVFITTHNLDFLKYATKYKAIGKKQKTYLIINKDRKSDGTWESKIQKMPTYMSEKVTEFNFLFEQIYKVASEEQNDRNYHIFYNFPNNARKFLETLLFFKYPSYKDQDSDSAWRFKEFFGKGVYEPFINRINNEYSHGQDRFDRLTKQINSAEFCKDAKLILQTIKEKDSSQYESLLNNSNLSDSKWIN
ncbi:AAA family ATPase [Carnobacterium maltaromaticum]|uniref:AAA family ATPase n=1 Tax=Carnobacterium maltaromaticum TaxID=2751 RepID=UPI0010721C6C|nr:AAA family ATPase [Carnobacterium maltaromaticum]TFJ75490.1 hypothetical protein CKN94_07560 [Carnobacterium maltaromaticum]TFJ78659.1 hypothetical protein CKN97_07555 [Carnobacterium maltaromaticum]